MLAYHMEIFRGVFFFQAEDGIRYLVRSRGLGDVYKRQEIENVVLNGVRGKQHRKFGGYRAERRVAGRRQEPVSYTHLTLPTSDLV